MTRDVRDSVLSYGCRRRRRSAHQKNAMISGRAIQPWDYLEMDFMSLGVKFLDNNEYVLLIVKKASKSLFSFSHPSSMPTAWYTTFFAVIFDLRCPESH